MAFTGVDTGKCYTGTIFIIDKEDERWNLSQPEPYMKPVNYVIRPDSDPEFSGEREDNQNNLEVVEINSFGSPGCSLRVGKLTVYDTGNYTSKEVLFHSLHSLGSVPGPSVRGRLVLVCSLRTYYGEELVVVF